MAVAGPVIAELPKLHEVCLPSFSVALDLNADELSARPSSSPGQARMDHSRHGYGQVQEE